MIIDQLPLLGGDVQGTDEFPIERGTTTYKTTQAALVKTATDAAAAAQLAADNAQDTADEANAKGLPPGGAAGQVLTKTDSSDYSASWEDPSGGDVTADMLGIVINGNSTPVGASVGQYVIVKDSTISGITDGLYTAALAIPANTAINSTYLTAIVNGGLNALSAVKKNILYQGASSPAITQLICGKTVTILIAGAISAATGSTTTITTFTEGLPANSAFAICAIQGGSSGKFALLEVRAAGDIKVYNYSGTNATFLYGSITYIIE